MNDSNDLQELIRLLPQRGDPNTSTIREKCGCGAEFEMTVPHESIDYATKQNNTWRRFHVCSVRVEGSQPAPRDEGWLNEGIGKPCEICFETIQTGDEREWTKLDKKWVHTSCLICEACHVETTGRALRWRRDEGRFVHLSCPRT